MLTQKKNQQFLAKAAESVLSFFRIPEKPAGDLP
jgi:hypothetical protein